MPKNISTYFIDSRTIAVKIGTKTFAAMVTIEPEGLVEYSKFTININQTDILFEVTEGAGQDVVLPETITIDNNPYEVLSGRLINENKRINPFYQLEIQKL